MIDSDEVHLILAENIKRMRATRGWGLIETARHTGGFLCFGQIARIERCQSSPALDSMCALANAFGVSLETLLTRRPHEEPQPC